MQQYLYQIDPLKIVPILDKLGLLGKNGNMDGRRMKQVLLPAIEATLEREPIHMLEHWGNRGWWYHGTLTEDEWVLIRLKFFV